MVSVHVDNETPPILSGKLLPVASRKWPMILGREPAALMVQPWWKTGDEEQEGNRTLFNLR